MLFMFKKNHFKINNRFKKKKKKAEKKSKNVSKDLNSFLK